MTGFDPDFPPALVRVSPNFGLRVGGGEPPRRPDMILLHYTGMPSARGALERLCDADAEVSAHYLVDEGGVITQMVPERLRAWHAGKSYWKGEADINSASIGIEIVNAGHDAGAPAYPVVQMRAVARLCRDIIGRYSIAPDRVLGHSDVSIGRKIDPGEWFDWAWLASEGVGHWVEPEPVGGGRFFQENDSGPPVEALQTMLSLYGYQTETHGIFGAGTKGAVMAFQRHFRPARVDGVADASTISTLHRLLSALPSLA
jgi:N-acetylmuramoyl-L-alanine amidase